MTKKYGLWMLAVFLLSTWVLSSLAFGDEYELSKIRMSIQAKGSRWTARETSVSALSFAEKQRLVGLNLPTSHVGERLYQGTHMMAPGSLPAQVDWRNKNGASYVTSVKNQGACGSCWDFATTAALESYTLIHKNAPNTDLNLSEQVLLSCSGAGNCMTGGWIDQASDFLRDTGLPLESCNTYKAKDDPCAYSCQDWKTSTYKLDQWKWVAETSPVIDDIKNALNTYGPLVTTMTVYNDFFYYGGGIYDYGDGNWVGYHAVLIVGYDDPGQYFIVKNSWGPGWGENGFIRMAYSTLLSQVGFGRDTIAYISSSPGPVCAYSINPTSTSLDYQGGSGQVLVTAASGCSWNASSTVPWVTINAGVSGSGNGMVAYMVAYNGTGSQRSGTITIAGQTFTVTQRAIPQNVTLSVAKSGSGIGTVTSNPGGVSCGATCTASFLQGTLVTLTATPDSGSTFAGWSGCTPSFASGICTVTMDTAKSVYATFNPPPGPRITSIIDGTTYNSTISPNTTITIFGSGFSTGGNTVQLQRAGYTDVWLYNGDGHYFWDYNGTQINASLDGRAAVGTWNVIVRNSSGAPSSPYILTIQNNVTPQISAVVDGSTYSSTIKPNTTIVVFGSNFSAGGNKIRLQRSGYTDVWLYNGDGHYFWDYNGTQINASLDNRAAAGTWSLTVQNASNATSNPYSINIQSNAQSNAFWCYSASYPYYGYQNWLCNAAYNPTYCYTASWQWTSCPW